MLHSNVCQPIYQWDTRICDPLYLKLFKHELAASAGHAVVNHYLGNENASPDAETMPEERQRRFWVRFFL